MAGLPISYLDKASVLPTVKEQLVRPVTKSTFLRVTSRPCPASASNVTNPQIVLYQLLFRLNSKISVSIAICRIRPAGDFASIEPMRLYPRCTGTTE